MFLLGISIKRLKGLQTALSNESLKNTNLQLLNAIGQGSFGTVYRATWRGSLVAAKVIGVKESEAKQISTEVTILR